MQFSCDLHLLSEVVNNVSLAVTSKSTVPVLEGILLRCKNSILTLTGYDLEIGILRSIEVKEEEEGSIVLNAQLFGEMLRKMRGPEVTISTDEKFMTVITDDETRYNILGISEEDYPATPSFSEEGSFSISDPMLRKMINQTIFAAAQNQLQNPILNGSLFEVMDKTFKVVAVDGYRVAIYKTAVESNINLSFVVPAKTLNEITKLLSDDEENITKVSVSKQHVVFEIGDYYIISRLLEGEYIDYNIAFPKETSTEIILNAKDLCRSVERVSILINIKNNTPIKMMAMDGQIKLRCESALGEGADQFDVDIKGEDVKIAFNNRYLIEALKHCEDDEVKILFNGSIQPIKICPKDGDNYTFLVLPVRLKTDI